MPPPMTSPQVPPLLSALVENLLAAAEKDGRELDPAGAAIRAKAAFPAHTVTDQELTAMIVAAIVDRRGQKSSFKPP